MFGGSYIEIPSLAPEKCGKPESEKADAEEIEG